MQLIQKFDFERFRSSIWPTLWGIFFIFCIIIWGLHLGQRAPDLNYPPSFTGFLGKIMPWVIGIAIFINPRLGLIFLVFALSLAPMEIGGRIVEEQRMKLRMEDYLIPFLYFIWLSRMWFKGKMRFVKVPLTLPIVLLTLCLTFSTLVGVMMNWAEPQLAFFFWLKYLEYFAMFYLMVNFVKEDGEREALIYALIFASVFVSGWAIFQGVTGYVTVTGRAGGRAAMPFDSEPATLGEYYIILIPLILFTLFPRRGVPRLLFNGLVAVAAFLGLFFSLSRGSQVGLLLALPIFLFIFIKGTRPAIVAAGTLLGLFVFFPDLFLNFSKTFGEISPGAQITIVSIFLVSVILALILAARHRLLVAVLAVAVVVFSLNPKFITRLSSVTEEVTSTDTVVTYDESGVAQITRNAPSDESSGIEEGKYHSFANRVTDLWPMVIDNISKSPFFGRGLTSIHVADNYYLRIWAEAGILGLICFLWLIFRMYRNLIDAFKISGQVWILRILSATLLITLTGLLIAGVSDDVFMPVKVMMHFWLLMGLFYSAYLRYRPAQESLNE